MNWISIQTKEKNQSLWGVTQTFLRRYIIGKHCSLYKYIVYTIAHTSI